MWDCGFPEVQTKFFLSSLPFFHHGLPNLRDNLVYSIMGEPPLDAMQSAQMLEISREEILKQIFGDVGELIDG